jgi:hypothetical protein
MPYGLIIEFTDNVDPAMYHAVNGKLGIDMETGTGDWPAGLISHAGGSTEEGFAVLEVWNTQAEQEAFLHDRLVPALQAVGVPAPSRMEWVELLGYQAPGR